MDIEYAKMSAVGDRDDNQDRAAVIVHQDAVLMLVFDGMGGHSDGAAAADTALRVVQEMFTSQPQPIFDPQGFLYTAMARAHDEVVALGNGQAADFRPRATSAVCLIQEAGAFWCHIGDSRIYHMRAGRMVTRSRDHSHVEVLIQEGAITEEQALTHPMRNFVECCLGGDAPVPDMTITRMQKLQRDDVLLACSDGLWTGLPDDDIASLATAPDKSVAENLKALSIKALTTNSPYSDNTTGTMLRWRGPQPDQP
ncbi:MAG: serine/threonine-protein phosphatase [Woeseia sp.]|nr:serine/threonine-protein phosphatase [Woeseia sp.]MBT8096610.1 serine/threonine-protein phosphatase [Woeseia sp.]NNE60709.1 serine/threonine-protein phosphatase [Woeseia sp.]NNL54711.1 serine/threonine-protein phosphatase [Woeseia sp.]